MLLVRECRGVTRGLLAASTTLLVREWRPGVSGAPGNIRCTSHPTCCTSYLPLQGRFSNAKKGDITYYQPDQSSIEAVDHSTAPTGSSGEVHAADLIKQIEV